MASIKRVDHVAIDVREVAQTTKQYVKRRDVRPRPPLLKSAGPASLAANAGIKRRLK